MQLNLRKRTIIILIINWKKREEEAWKRKGKGEKCETEGHGLRERIDPEVAHDRVRVPVDDLRVRRIAAGGCVARLHEVLRCLNHHAPEGCIQFMANGCYERIAEGESCKGSRRWRLESAEIVKVSGIQD